MFNFHDSTDIFVNPSFLPFCTRQMLHPELALKPGILVPKVACDLPEFKIRPRPETILLKYTPEAYVH